MRFPVQYQNVDVVPLSEHLGLRPVGLTQVSAWYRRYVQFPRRGDGTFQEILKEEAPKEEGDDEEGPAWWEKYPNLSALAEELKRKNLPVWDDGDFFADEVATKLYPHRPPLE